MTQHLSILSFESCSPVSSEFLNLQCEHTMLRVQVEI